MKFNDICDYVLEANVYLDKETGLEKEFGVPYIIKGKEMIMDPTIEARIERISTMDKTYKLAQLSKVLALQAKGISASPVALQEIIRDIFEIQKQNAEFAVTRPRLVEPLTVSGIKQNIISTLQRHNNISDEEGITKKAGVLSRAADRIFPWLAKQKFIRPMTQLDKEEGKLLGSQTKKQKEQQAIDALSKHIETGYDVSIKGQEKPNIEPQDVESLLGYRPGEME